MSEALYCLLDKRKHLIASLHPGINALAGAFKELLQTLFLRKKRLTASNELLRVDFAARSHVGQAVDFRKASLIRLLLGFYDHVTSFDFLLVFRLPPLHGKGMELGRYFDFIHLGDDLLFEFFFFDGPLCAIGVYSFRAVVIDVGFDVPVDENKEKLFYPDWIFKAKDKIWIVDTKKGATAELADTAYKAEALQEWLKGKRGISGGIVVQDGPNGWVMNSNTKYSYSPSFKGWDQLKDVL